MTTNSTAALMHNGKILACASEERFTRQKNTYAYPKQAIEYCLKESGIAPPQLDRVALVGDVFPYQYWKLDKQVTFTVADKVREQHEYWQPQFYGGTVPDYLGLFPDKIASYDTTLPRDPRRILIQHHLGVPDTAIQYFPHHASHAYYGYYGAPREQNRNYLVFTIEGWGDTANASVAIGQQGTLRWVSKSTNCQLGRLYRYVTLLLGLNYDADEYKVMGLAAYASEAQSRAAYEVFANTMYVQGLGFAYHEIPTDLYFWFQRRLEGMRFDHIAGGLQRYTEMILCQWVSNAIRETGVSDVLFSGGVAMNCKAMLAVSQLPEVSSLHVCPTPSDESLAMGVCYYATANESHDQLAPLTDAYLGPTIPAGSSAVRPREIAERLVAGELVGLCRGRMEFGARALGHRTILARPDDVRVVRQLNRAVKRRDFWMPFSPVILQERASDYLVNPKGISHHYMTVASETTPLAQRELIAALHPADFTARPFVVSKTMNPFLYAILEEFEALTGIGGLLNTSLNLHGEPIACTAEDAMLIFEQSELDHLVLGAHMLSKRGTMVGYA